MLLPVLLLFAQDAPDLEAAMAEYRARTRADVPCRKPGDDGEIVVCALREADRYRVPFVSADPGRDSDGARLKRLIGDPVQQGITPCGQGAILTHCGSVGVSGTMGFDGKVRLQERELAP